VYWYMAMAYLQKNDTQKTISQLHTLLSKQPPAKYKEMAKELITSLEE
jgi:hypothetical protein